MNTLKQSNIDFIQDSEYRVYCNCWGATLYAFGKIKHPDWIEVNHMNDFLDKKTKPIQRRSLKKGDIVAFYAYWAGRHCDLILTHTAIYMGKNKWWHKPGSYPSEFTTMTGMKHIYYDTDKVKYFRLKNTK